MLPATHSHTLTHPHRECSDAVLLCFLSEGTSYKLVVFFLSFFGIQRAHSFRSSSCNRYRFLFPVKNTLLHSMYGMLHWRRSCLTSGLPVRGKVFTVLPGDPSVFFLCLLSLLLFFCSCASSFFSRLGSCSSFNRILQRRCKIILLHTTV